MTQLLLHEVSIGERLVDIACEAGVVTSIDPPRPRTGLDTDVVIEGEGRPVIPGLHDHHIHLFATVAAMRSVKVGPPEVSTWAELIEALRTAARSLPPKSWIRAVGYHESVAGDLDRTALDGLLAEAQVHGRPVRIQHRSGALWVLSSIACDELSLGGDDPRRDTGQLWREDAWLRGRLETSAIPDLAELGRQLAAFGVTGVTDATPLRDPSELDVLARAARDLPQRLYATGGVELADNTFPEGLIVGPVKVIIADHDLPTIDDLADALREAHANHRAAAVHCVSRAALVLALAAWDQVGVHDGDRIEHASLVPDALIGRITELGLRVVTQPNFITEHGDQYLADLDETDLGNLYRLRTLIEAGVRVAAGTDAPYGNPDPWSAMAAAMRRRTPKGQVIGAGETLSGAAALDLFLSPQDDPGGQPRRIAPGRPADLVMLDRPLTEVLRNPDRLYVDTTIIAGRIVHGSPGQR